MGKEILPALFLKIEMLYTTWNATAFRTVGH
jgi:hypothetical protein